MATIIMKTISQLDNNSGHANTWDGHGFYGCQERVLEVDIGTTDIRLVNTAGETAGYKYGDDPRSGIEPGTRSEVMLPAPESGGQKMLLLFTNGAADVIPFVTLKLTKKTGG
ncbi:MAG TPA: hypothetical protein ENJ18_02215 [Nannocystis exedens]|nr:hypothetical protein [Nannocystis exedens]